MGKEMYQDNNERDDDKPPSYFTAVLMEPTALDFAAISQNGVYGNAGRYSEPSQGSRNNWKHVSINMGRDSSETPPPPYSVSDPLKCSRFPSTNARPVLDGSSGCILASPLADILNSSESFTFGPGGKIYNDKGESVLATINCLGLMNLQDSEGNIRLAMNAANVISVQGRTIGKLSVFDDNYRIIIKSPTEQSITILKGKPQKEREIDSTFISNGKECGNVGTALGDNERLQLTFKSAVEVNTKALMLLSAALLMEYHERNAWSRMTYPEWFIRILLLIFIEIPLYFLCFIYLFCTVVIDLVLALLMCFWGCLPGCTIT